MTLPRLIASAKSEPVSLAQLKAHIRNTQDSEDADLSLKLSAASGWLEDELSRALITSTWEITLNHWPHRGADDTHKSAWYIALPANTQRIISVKYTDCAGVEHTWDPSNYKLARAYDPGDEDHEGMGATDCGAARLYLAYGRYWPQDVLDVGEPIVIRLVAGWADAESVPFPIQNAILMIAEHLWRNRSAVIADRGVVSEEIALGVQRLTGIYEDRQW